MKTIKHYDWLMWLTILFIVAFRYKNLYGEFSNWPINQVILYCTFILCMIIRMRASD